MAHFGQKEDEDADESERRTAPDDEAYDRQREAREAKQLGDMSHTDGDAQKAENCGYQRDQEEAKRGVHHNTSSSW